MYSLYKLSCFTRSPSPEKGCNNTKVIYNNFLCVWYRQSADDTPLAFCVTLEGPSLFSVQGCLSKFSWILATNNTEYFVSLTDSDVQTFLEVEKKQNTKRETKSYHALVMAFLVAANEIKQLEDLTQANFDSQ